VAAAPAVWIVPAGGDMVVELVVELVVGVAGGLILLSAIAVGLSIACHPLWLVRWVQKFQPRVLYLAPTNEKVIALTLDDGPHAHITPQASSFLLFDFMPNLKKVEVGKKKKTKKSGSCV
jgi:hypothetical protein